MHWCNRWKGDSGPVAGDSTSLLLMLFFAKYLSFLGRASSDAMLLLRQMVMMQAGKGHLQEGRGQV